MKHLFVMIFGAVILTGCGAGVGVGGPGVTAELTDQYGLDFPTNVATGQCKKKEDRPQSKYPLSIADWLSCYQIPPNAEADEARLFRAQAIVAVFSQYGAFVIREGNERAKSDALALIGAIRESQTRIQGALDKNAEFKGLPNVIRARTINGAYGVMMVALQPTARNARGLVSKVATAITDAPMALLQSEDGLKGLQEFILRNRTVNTYLTAFRADVIYKLVALRGDQAGLGDGQAEKWGETSNEADWAPLGRVIQKACDKLVQISGESDFTCGTLVTKP